MTTQLAPDRLGLPPPLDMDLIDAGRRAGWIANNVVGFRGFGDETEAAHAAWVAHRTLARRLARHGVRPVPVDIEPLALQRVDGREMVVASGRPIAALVRPGPDSRSGADSFGFELSIPTPITELEVRALAYLVYRTLRKSGIRWAMWRSLTRSSGEPSAAQTSVQAATVSVQNGKVGTNDLAERTSHIARRLPAVLAGRDTPGLTGVALAVVPLSIAAVLSAAVAQLVTIPLAAAVLAAVSVGGVMLLRSRRLG